MREHGHNSSAGSRADREHHAETRPPGPSTPELSRRALLGGAAGTLGLVMAPSLWLPKSASAATGRSLTGSTPLRLAMHVHGTWSEGAGSWESQFQQASANGFDVLYLTDHDMRATAYNYATSLAEATYVSSSSGSFIQKEATPNGGSLRLLAESSSTTAPAVLTMALQDKPFCFNRLRTSIAGLTITQQISSITLTGAARYDLVVLLSYHPARNARPAGQYRLVYRFGGRSARWTAQNGLVGYVRTPTPSAGSTQVLRPEQDIAALWPDMLAIDNNHYGMSFVVRSPAKGQVADVTIGSLTFTRSQSSPEAVMANQAKVVEGYAAQYPTVAGRPQVEYSLTLPDLNAFGMPQWMPDQAALPADSDARHQQIVDTAHGMGGLVSYNHPFGYNGGPLLPPTDRDVKRRNVFTAMQAVGRFGTDILEVGYSLRGNVDTGTHIDLWDTFSRNGNFLTGNGTSDDHSGNGWKTMNNGFATGAWAASRSEADLKQALQAGRAYTGHIGLWPGGQLDMLVDNVVPMGGISVSTKTSRKLAIFANRLPSGSVVQLVAGPVDYAGAVDPGTAVVQSLSASRFTKGPATVTVDTSTDRFYRATVRLSNGKIVGTGNPVWLLRSAPPGGIPVGRG